MRDVVIVSAARTAIGRAPKGAFRSTRPDELAAVVVKSVLDRAPGIDPVTVDDIILGCAMPEAEQGMNVARVAALRAGLPDSVPAATINRFCASGLEAIATGAAKIATGHADVVVAGGVESMSLVTFMGPSTRPNPWLIANRPDTYLSMGLSVESISDEFDISRESADAFALESHRKALAAQDAGRFDAEIVPVTTETQVVNGEHAQIRRAEVAVDEGPRRETSAEALAKLRPAFLKDGVITAGNASQRSDGAAAVALMTPENAERLGLTPLARFAGYSVAAVAPERFGIAPAFAMPRLLKRMGLTIDQFDLIEFNEAFAAQVLASDRLFPLPLDRVNVNGGACALGHPLGCTGARQAVSMVFEAKRRGAKRGLITMCAALGMGAAGVLEFAY
ncbi:MAG: thiolase family protein [Armatimonadetes bacterium]|nr:thiolase family protein [Armatimonadota bacterium]MDE2205508.1 thiolase family protein [Armatimonadota bacterium]